MHILIFRLQKLVIVQLSSMTCYLGFPEFKKVDILWKDCPNSSKSSKGSLGGLYLRVFMSEKCDRDKFWSTLVDSCLRIRDIIDWERSHPDDIHDITPAYGIDVAVNHFLSVSCSFQGPSRSILACIFWLFCQKIINKLTIIASMQSLNSAICDAGKTILPEHLVLTADCLSATGEFVALNAKGLAQQRKETAVSSPFLQACFSVSWTFQFMFLLLVFLLDLHLETIPYLSPCHFLQSPGDCFVRAAKTGIVDNLEGAVDALSWGMVPSIGTGARFDIMYSGKVDNIGYYGDIYTLLKNLI